MTINEAIKKAVEGGMSYYPKNYNEKELIQLLTGERAFWQSLGKSLGWVTKNEISHSGQCAAKIKRCGIIGTDPKHFDTCYMSNSDEWRWKWHRFIDHLAEGKDAESWFENLR